MKQQSTDEVIRLYDSKEAGNFLHVGADHVRFLCKQKKLSHRRRGRAYLFTAEDLNSYLGGTVVQAKK